MLPKVNRKMCLIRLPQVKEQGRRDVFLYSVGSQDLNINIGVSVLQFLCLCFSSEKNDLGMLKVPCQYFLLNGLSHNIQ